jgi:endo-1,4-beta-D-glucanase Y
MLEKTNTVFTSWTQGYYSECSDGKRARIKWLDPKASSQGCSADGSCTVSEGIGYGMLIMVYTDNATNKNQPKFDKLWAYYQHFADGNGVMKWLVDGCNSAKADGGATDSEMDVALALVMAWKQWKSETYLIAAKDLLTKIWNSEVDGGKLLKPGDLWGSPYNPSYFAIGALRVFASVDPAHDWNTVANNSLALIKKNQNATTGLNSDWCDGSGTPQDKNGSGNNKFGYDAARTPWRVLLDYLWFGTSDSKQALTKINQWIMPKAKAPRLIRAEYNLDGSTTVTTWTNSLYMGALALPGMVDDTADTWNQNALTQVSATAEENYYQDSWKILYLLTAIGNFQNFAGTVKPMKTGVIGADGRSVPHGWSVRRSRRGVRVELPEAGSADLLDAKGVVVSSMAGSKSMELVKPLEAGVYYAVVRCAGRQSVLPVMGD